MEKIAVIGIPGKWSSERIADAIEVKTGFRMIIDMHDVALDTDAKTVRYKDLDLMSLDGLVIKKIVPQYSHYLLDRLEILMFLENMGLPIFSSPYSIFRAVNRLSCTLTLSRKGLPVPETVITENVDEAMTALKRFGSAVFKPLFTSKARGMMVLEWNESARDRIEEYKARHPILYIQKLEEIAGQDYGVAFLGGKYLATYARVGKEGSWNTTTHYGGRYQPYDPPPEWIDLATKAQAAFNLDFTCVDMAMTANGPVIFEVSAFGGYRGLLEANNIDAASLFADHIVGKLHEAAR